MGPLIAAEPIKETKPLFSAGSIKETVPECDLENEEKTKEKASQEKISDSVVETKLVTVSSPQKPLEAGQVVLTVYKARDIEKKGMLGKADPYVKITLGKQKARSGTVKNNHNPEWNFKTIFDVDQNTSEGINIEVFDDDFGKDDSLGNTLLDISKVQEHQQLLNQWIPLEECKSGEVLISAEFIPLEKIQQQKGVEPIIAAGSIKETIKEVDTVTKKIKEKTPPELAIEVEPLIAA